LEERAGMLKDTRLLADFRLSHTAVHHGQEHQAPSRLQVNHTLKYILVRVTRLLADFRYIINS
jgi:hypothetical protein